MTPEAAPIDLVYERQWRPMPYPVLTLQHLGRMGRLYGGFPKFRYAKAGIPAETIRTFPVAALWNHAAGKLHLPPSLQLNEPRWVGNWVASHHDLAPTVWANGTAHCFLFPRLRGTGRTLILERGSMEPIEYYLRPQKARHEAGYSYSYDVPAQYYDEIEKTKLADLIFACSDYVRQSYIKRGFPEERVVDTTFGIDSSTFPFTERKPAHQRAIRVGVVGVIGFRKGLHRLLKIGEWAKRKGLSLEIHFAGPIQDPEAHEMFARSDAQYFLHGIIKGRELLQFLANCDLYALPSYEEGLPFSVLEAMSTGLGAIVSNDTGAREVVQHGKSGLILEHFSDDELDRELAPLLADEQLILSHGRAARDRILENYTLDHYFRRIADALSRLEKAKQPV
jgi:glycosyltransferase involved in cell wall biosynthesis